MNDSFGKVRHYLVRLVPVAAAICFLCWCYVSVRPFHAWDDAEPEILNQAWRLSQGEQIYRTIDTPPYLHTAYPPLYFAIVAAALKLTGLSYLPAKLVSFLSVLAIGVALALLGRTWQGSAKWGLWATCCLFLIPAFLYNTARTHVQMLAVALSIWSFVLFLRADRLATIASAVLAVLAVYTKQTQVALPLAMVVYLALRDRRRLLPYVATLALAGTIPLVWLQWVTDGYFLRHTITLNALSYRLVDIPLVVLHYAGPVFLFIGLAAYEVSRRFGERRAEAVDFYFVSVGLATAIACGRLGAHTQYVVDLCVVVFIVLLRTAEFGTMRGLDRLVSLQLIILLLYSPLFVFIEEGRFGMASNRAAKQVHALLRTEQGPVLAQQSSFALFSRGELYIQLFHFTALARAGLWDMGKLQREVETRSFAWVITEFPIEGGTLSPDDLERFTPEIVDALHRNYQRAETIPPYFIYRPALR